MGVWVGGHPATNFSHRSKDAQKIPYLLILIHRARIDAEKHYAEKTTQKIDFTGVKISWVDLKSKKLVGLISSTCWKYHAQHFREFSPENAHANKHHPRIFKNS